MKAMQNNSKEFKIIRRETPYQGFFRLEKYRLKHTPVSYTHLTLPTTRMV